MIVQPVLLFLIVGSSFANDAGRLALDYVRANAATFDVTASDVADIVVSSETVSERLGVTHVYVQQRHRGIDVFNALMTINVARDGRIVSHDGRFIARLDPAANITPVLAAPDAVQAAAAHLGLVLTEPIRIVRKPAGVAQEMLVSGGGVAARPIEVKLVFYPTHDGPVRLSWHVNIEERGEQHWWTAIIDAGKGTLLEKADRVKAGTH